MQITGGGPVCRGEEANAILETFKARADNANRSYKSDQNAETNIEMYYRDAVQQLTALSTDKENLDSCLGILRDTAGRADAYRDGFLSRFFVGGQRGNYVPPSEMSPWVAINPEGWAVSATFTLFTLGVYPVVSSGIGYSECLWNYIRY